MVHEAALNISELIQAVPKKSLGMNTAAAELAGSASYSAHAALSHVEDAQTEDDKLQTASAHLTDDGQRARNLHMAVMQIETAVADALYKNLDVTHIYSTAKMSYSALAGDVVAAQKSTKAAAGKVDAAGLKIAKAVGGTASANAQPGDDETPTTKNDVKTVANALEQAKNDSAKTQNIADTFDSCVADATATPQTQTTPSTPEPGGGSNQ
jgi:cysteinyl-tRNA synthetase